ncbi:glycogen debranching protein GlgX [bacterium]|nr:glycogen debranching protein GlgX [bacterium]
MESNIKTLPGSPLPLGVSKQADGFNFAVFSQNAATIKLCIGLFRDKSPDLEIFFDSRKNRTGDIWHIQVKGLPDRFYYVYKVTGPCQPDMGLIFDGGLELLDPYTKTVCGLEEWSKRDSKVSTKNYYQEAEYDWEGDKPINRPLSETIIYELHVRGFTKNDNSAVSNPGTFRGLMEKVGYLKELGITAVELLPIHEFDETDCKYTNPETGERLLDYWGYSSLNFFTVKSSYASNNFGVGAQNEFRDMVKALHKEGIEIILDVVFNHTAEGGRDRKTISFKGLENSVYYILDDAGDYRNFSGCGNTMNCNHPVVIKMILDSLRYFVVEMHVDGFRFDLASIFSRGKDGEVIFNPPILEMIAKDPILSKTKLIAEAWDAGGLYQVGSFHASDRWAEWNDRFRDTIRRFCRGEAGIISELATRISGSEDLFKSSKRNPTHSINFITAHDGFALMDLVSYEERHNEQNGQGNTDGSGNNYSMNFGVEGETSDGKVLAKRHKQVRNFATLLMLSQGTPMMVSGDEFGNSHFGNNNPWCQDNEISWLDWNLYRENRELFQFWRMLIRFRKTHPIFRRDSFFTGKINPISDLADISWHNQKLNQPDFDNSLRSLAFLIDGKGDQTRADDTFYIVLNFNDTPSLFELPLLKEGHRWQEVLCTANPQGFINNHMIPLDYQLEYIELEEFSIKVLLEA